MRRIGSLGPTAQKTLLLLLAGPALLLAYHPKRQIKVLKQFAKEWEDIEKRALYNSIRTLYKNKLVDAKENNDGTITLVLTDSGKKKALTYDIENVKIKPMKKWDDKWRIILFDIPEKHKRARDAVAKILKSLGCRKFQKSVFIHPYECRNEIDFVVEFFSMRPYVRYIEANYIDNELHYKKYFDLLDKSTNKLIRYS